ncbi:uncharacterized protein [Blastocystis hominis]|uniref:DDRGK domain-containing protein 1 n=2 Tax=Blastocystis hominis TaxID=12968 RepID=D8LV26_BLAHO|nr:uncharacterized protein [Blastocystis hominis]CBK19665.2 unnamed protein product [Blastocystis hominis]|eukprot:XP_012893713.1 uncharacterized protein [Blastocystis hominis]
MKKKEKAEKRARDEYEREMRKAREEKRQQEEQRKEEERAKQREEEELRARLAEEERLRREEEEYAKWEQFITLEGEGTDAKEDLFSNQERLDSFIDTLRSRKVADIDEIASEFNMTQEVCDEVEEAIKRLEDEGKLTVLVDDRGKLVYVTEEEMQKIVEVIKENGRISLKKLTALCNYISFLWIACIMEDEEYQFESNLEEEEDYGFGESSDESTEEIVDYEGMKNALELFQQSDIAKEALENGVDLVEYEQKIVSDLTAASQASVADYIAESRD